MKEIIKGYTVEVIQDECSEQPDWLQSLIVHWHPRYELGGHISHEKGEEIEEHWRETGNVLEEFKSYGNVLKPVYLLDHSGLRISVRDFGDAWDSGQVGFAIGESEEQIANDVAVFDQYLQGDVWFVSVRHPNGELVESLGGCYGYDYACEEAKSIVENLPQVYVVGEELQFTGVLKGYVGKSRVVAIEGKLVVL